MSNYPNDKLASGSLSRNPRKYTYDEENRKFVFIEDANPKGPDYTGKLTLTINGQSIPIYVSGWIRQSDNGASYLSIAADYSKNDPRRLAIAGHQRRSPEEEAAAMMVPINETTGLEELPF